MIRTANLLRMCADWHDKREPNGASFLYRELTDPLVKLFREGGFSMSRDQNLDDVMIRFRDSLSEDDRSKAARALAIVDTSNGKSDLKQHNAGCFFDDMIVAMKDQANDAFQALKRAFIVDKDTPLPAAT